MTDCEICGNSNATKKAEIDGAILNVCNDCAALGKTIIESVEIRRKPILKDLPESSQYVDSDYSRIIREARQKAKIERKEFASRIGEKESLIAKVESGKISPSLKLARKLERFLGISLIFEYD